MLDFVLRSAKAIVPLAISGVAMIFGVPVPDGLEADIVSAIETTATAGFAIVGVVNAVLVWLVPNKAKA